MKEKCEEKIRINRPNAEKKFQINENSRFEDSLASKLELKKPKNISIQPRTKAGTTQKIRPKSKSSCELETIDQIKGNFKRENSENRTDRTDLQREISFSVSSKEAVREKIKKNKSLDQVEKISLKNLSKTSLAKKVSDVLQQVRIPKTTSQIDLFHSNTKFNSQQYPPVSSTLDNYFPKVNSFGSNRNVKLQNIADKQISAAKSLSFDSLKFSYKTKQLSKCSSVENGKNATPEKPIGVFNVHKKSYCQTPEAFLRKVEPLWTHKGYANRQGKLFEVHKGNVYKTTAGETSSGNNNSEYGEEQTVESVLKSPKLSCHTLDPAKKYNNQSWQGTIPEKTSVRLCQCLHCHTEDGLKKLCLHNNHNASEFGRKFFRVNYYSKKDEEDEDSDGKVELVDKETITDNDLNGLKTEEQSKSRQKSMKFPVNKKSITKPNPLSRIPKAPKQEKVNKKEPQVVLWRNENQMQLLGQPSVSKQQKSIPSKTLKSKKDTEKKKQGNLEKSRGSKERIVQQKALEELEILEKLFLKLNSVEKLLLRHTNSQQNTRRRSIEDKNLSKDLLKKAKNGTEISKNKSSQGCSSFETEEEYLRRRNKLRNAVIRHVQDFLKLDFSFN